MVLGGNVKLFVINTSAFPDSVSRYLILRNFYGYRVLLFTPLSLTI